MAIKEVKEAAKKEAHESGVELANEVDVANLYLTIEQTRFVDRLTVVFSIAEDANEALVPSFLLQPLIENAIKHAIAQNEDGGIIRVTADADGDMLRVWVEDSGSGHRSSDSAQKVSGAGLGLQNVRERMAALYGERGRLKTGPSDLGGFRVDLAFPLETRVRGVRHD